MSNRLYNLVFVLFFSIFISACSTKPQIDSQSPPHNVDIVCDNNTIINADSIHATEEGLLLFKQQSHQAYASYDLFNHTVTCASEAAPKSYLLPAELLQPLSHRINEEQKKLSNATIKLPEINSMQELEGLITHTCRSIDLPLIFRAEKSEQKLVFGCQENNESKSALMFTIAPREDHIGLILTYSKQMQSQAEAAAEILQP